ncbi:hypothetical protein OSB04_023525 [Centaurea solstitialis]|uniref:Uncharacterized protein n=1 Tax=Centaurea solstitialis TaxID=347529 RepID=A0AA38T3Z9_9ASTR|nr:hypothetical protein OSB04_023525 [Centaurea solstitialis]
MIGVQKSGRLKFLLLRRGLDRDCIVVKFGWSFFLHHKLKKLQARIQHHGCNEKSRTCIPRSWSETVSSLEFVLDKL